MKNLLSERRSALQVKAASERQPKSTKSTKREIARAKPKTSFLDDERLQMMKMAAARRLECQSQQACGTSPIEPEATAIRGGNDFHDADTNERSYEESSQDFMDDEVKRSSIDHTSESGAQQVRFQVLRTY